MTTFIEDTLWETEYLINEILPEGEIKIIPSEHIERLYVPCDVLVFSVRKHDFWNIRTTIRRIKPKVVIMLSDEFHQENLYNYNALGFECELFLRNYHHRYYNYTSNTIIFPLGYTSGCKKFISDKKYDWAFVGKIKEDREKMINIFSKFSNHYISTEICSEEMCKIYSQSYFVPCGRGNSSLDCFRLYEASMNGAIPVVVGSKEELEYTFKYEENPPWIFADTWESALHKCNHLLEDKKFLEEMSDNVLNWWCNRITKIRKKVLEVL